MKPFKFLVGLIVSLVVLGQSAPSSAPASTPPPMKAYETADYTFTVPEVFRKMEMGKPFDYYFEASGTFLPITFNQKPVMVTVWVIKDNAASLEQLKEDTIKGYAENPDRVFPDGFKHELEKITLKSGQPAYLVNTRFFRKSKGLNQSRFDLCTFNNGHAYVITLSIQYDDPEYEFEAAHKLKGIAKGLFTLFVFKSEIQRK
jgi:hypothetical protein